MPQQRTAATRQPRWVVPSSRSEPGSDSMSHTCSTCLNSMSSRACSTTVATGRGDFRSSVVHLQDARAPFTLPDGRLVSISHEEAAEVASCLLQPALMGIDCPSVVETAAASIFSHLDPAVRKVGATNATPM